ncbi:MAG: hypothetical protein C0439_14370 [Pseudomonas sp.]|nr:hypothetical protein [Pseudomonas sp.]
MAWPLVLNRDDRSGRQNQTMEPATPLNQQVLPYESAGIMPTDGWQPAGVIASGLRLLVISL